MSRKSAINYPLLQTKSGEPIEIIYYDQYTPDGISEERDLYLLPGCGFCRGGMIDSLMSNGRSGNYERKFTGKDKTLSVFFKLPFIQKKSFSRNLRNV